VTLVRCSFVSDLHLDATMPERVDAFHRFLQHESSRCDELYLLGDLTEAWIGDDDDSSFAESLKAELFEAGQHCRIRLMHGNRDFLIGDDFAHVCGVELIDDPFVIERNGKRLLLCHGDSLCTDDLPYQQTRAVLRSRAWQDDVKSKPLSERRSLANAMRAQSRAANANKPSNIMDAADSAIVDAVLRHRADALVHGHTHRPGIHRIAETAVRYVLGDWDRCGWLLRFDGRFSLLRFPLAGRCEI
jgi:UDP-2,3-diacylglucosamine hydrolase